MNRWLIPAGSLTAIVVAIVVALFVAGAFDGGGTSADLSDDGAAEGDAARCAEGAEDCDDTSGGDALGICVSEDDPLYDPDIPCQDTVVNDDGGDDPADAEAPPDGGGGDSLNVCIEGVADCGDMVVGDPAFADDSENLAIEAAFAKLAEMGVDAGGVEVTGVSAVEWSDSCLGLKAEGIACAEVITPGFIIVLSGGGDWEFHTDTNGNAVFVPQD